MMYRVFIRIYTDGDFYYENNITGFDKDSSEIDLYFEDRDNINNFINNFYQHMCDTISNYDQCLDKTIQKIKGLKKYVNMIVNVFEYFQIDFSYGNQYIEIDVLPANSKTVKIQDTNKNITIYDRGSPESDNEYPYFTNSNINYYWDWDAIKSSDKLWK